MSTQHYRVLVAAANLLLLLGVAFLVWKAFTGGDKASLGSLSNFDPRRYVIETQGGKRSSWDEFRVIGPALDRPKPKPPPVIREEPKIEQPRVQDLSRLYSLVMANYNSKDPSTSTVILEGRGRQIALGIGDSFDGYEVTEITVEGTGEDRQAIVKVKNRAQIHTIQLRPRRERKGAG